MNWKFLLLPLGLLALSARAQQPKRNERLRYQLDSLDQAYRRYEQRTEAAFARAEADSLLQPVRLPNGNLAGYAGPAIGEVAPDSSDLRLVTAIIRRYGYPGKSLVGPRASQIAWQVLQRTGHTTRFLPQLRVAAAAGELPYPQYAQAVDLQLMQAGKSQRYGTQIMDCLLPNKITGQVEVLRFLWPVADVSHVNDLRRRAGFTTTLAQEARLLGFSLAPMSLPEAVRLKQAAESGE